ncbi:hypothetical protein C8R47DRAFT_1079559 [Mycena vitilis]|nr:hypothetical protein C8R47DRAFT_1079559 [Mycena vitilis]
MFSRVPLIHPTSGGVHSIDSVAGGPHPQEMRESYGVTTWSSSVIPLSSGDAYAYADLVADGPHPRQIGVAANYRGARLFESVLLTTCGVGEYFPGTCHYNRTGGVCGIAHDDSVADCPSRGVSLFDSGPSREVAGTRDPFFSTLEPIFSGVSPMLSWPGRAAPVLVSPADVFKPNSCIFFSLAPCEDKCCVGTEDHMGAIYDGGPTVQSMCLFDAKADLTPSETPPARTTIFGCFESTAHADCANLRAILQNLMLSMIRPTVGLTSTRIPFVILVFGD